MASCEESEAVLEYWKYKETHSNVLGPHFLQTVECAPPEWLPLLIIAIILWIATCIVSFISARRFNSYRWSKTFIFVMSNRIIFYYAVYSLLNVISILNAAGAVTYQYISDVVEALCFINFYMLIWSYTGGIAPTMKKMMGLELNLGQPPFCCLRCVPNIRITESFLRKVELCMKQLPTVQFVAGLINVTLIQSGIPAGITEHWSTTLLNVIMTISFMVSMWATGTLFACWSQFVVGRSVKAKFAVFKITIVLAKVQAMVLSFCSSSVKKHGYYTGENRTEMWGAFLVCVECLLLSIAASFLYKTSDYDQAHPASIGYKKNDDTVENGMDDLEEVDLGKPSLVLENPNV
ncbi:hypothetical protein ACHWQZ_G014146 [Mnemiopsis leidyi]